MPTIRVTRELKAPVLATLTTRVRYGAKLGPYPHPDWSGPTACRSGTGCLAPLQIHAPWYRG